MLDLDVIYEPKFVSAEQFSDIQRRIYRAWQEWVKANCIKKGDH